MGPMLLPIALGVVMLSLGLALTLDDFRRVLKFPLAVIVACLPDRVAAAGLLRPCVLFRLPPELAVGLMLLTASPAASWPMCSAISRRRFGA